MNRERLRETLAGIQNIVWDQGGDGEAWIIDEKRYRELAAFFRREFGENWEETYEGDGVIICYSGQECIGFVDHPKKAGEHGDAYIFGLTMDFQDE